MCIYLYQSLKGEMMAHSFRVMLAILLGLNASAICELMDPVVASPAAKISISPQSGYVGCNPLKVALPPRLPKTLRRVALFDSVLENNPELATEFFQDARCENALPSLHVPQIPPSVSLGYIDFAPGVFLATVYVRNSQAQLSKLFAVELDPKSPGIVQIGDAVDPSYFWIQPRLWLRTPASIPVSQCIPVDILRQTGGAYAQHDLLSQPTTVVIRSAENIPRSGGCDYSSDGVMKCYDKTAFADFHNSADCSDIKVSSITVGAGELSKRVYVRTGGQGRSPVFDLTDASGAFFHYQSTLLAQ
jgi:hypothetical protein